MAPSHSRRELGWRGSRLGRTHTHIQDAISIGPRDVVNLTSAITSSPPMHRRTSVLPPLPPRLYAARGLRLQMRHAASPSPRHPDPHHSHVLPPSVVSIADAALLPIPPHPCHPTLRWIDVGAPRSIAGRFRHADVEAREESCAVWQPCVSPRHRAMDRVGPLPCFPYEVRAPLPSQAGQFATLGQCWRSQVDVWRTWWVQQARAGQKPGGCESIQFSQLPWHPTRGQFTPRERHNQFSPASSPRESRNEFGQSVDVRHAPSVMVPSGHGGAQARGLGGLGALGSGGLGGLGWRTWRTLADFLTDLADLADAWRTWQPGVIHSGNI
eukprot:gene13866-biopygen8685